MLSYLLCGLLAIGLCFPEATLSARTKYYYDENSQLLFITSPEGESYQFEHDRNGNVVRREHSTNLLFNPGFERGTLGTGTAEGWTHAKYPGVTSSAELVVSPVSGGDRAQKITASHLRSDNEANLAQDVWIQPNRIMAAQARILVSSLSHAKVVFSVHFYDHTDTWVGNGWTHVLTSTNSYMTLNTSGTAPANAAFARVTVHLSGTNTTVDGSITVYVDDLKLYYTDEPNLLFNPGMEQGQLGLGTAEGWTDAKYPGVSSSAELVTSPVSGGKRAQKITASHLRPDNDARLAQDVWIQPNRTVATQVRIYVASLNHAKVVFSTHFYDNTNTWVGNSWTHVLTPTSSYVTLNISGTAPVNAAFARVTVHLSGTNTMVDGSITVYIDDLKLYYTEESNLLFNPGMEQGQLGVGTAGGWTHAKYQGVESSAELVTSPVSGGKRAQKITASHLRPDNDARLAQDVWIQPNRQLTTQAGIYVASSSHAKVVFSTHFYDNTNTWVGNSWTHVLTPTSSYVTLNISGTAPSNAAFARVTVNVSGTNTTMEGNITVYVDDLKLFYTN